MFCTQCGKAFVDGSKFCTGCGAQVGQAQAPSVGAGGKDAVLAAIETALAAKPGLSLVRGQNADIEIASVPADANWMIGKKKVTYSACLLADAASRTVVFWEMLKESGFGLSSLFSFKVETYRSDGKTISGNVKEVGYGPGGKVLDYKWDYSQVRSLVENEAQKAGWSFKTVLSKGKAMYP